MKQGKRRTGKSESWLERPVRAVIALARSHKGGAMLVGGSFAMLTMASVGGMVVNYGWKEAQEAEIQAVLRAGIASSAHFMRGNITANEAKIKERVANFMRGLLDDLIIAAGDIVVDHDLATNRTTISVGGNATYGFRSLWAGGAAGDPQPLEAEATVEFDQSEFEFALALDISKSMGDIPVGWSITRLDALKDAIRTIAQTVDDLSRTNPGVATLSLVPFSNVVNVADMSGIWQTEAKERYVRMITGAEYSTQTSRDTEGHWVDTFHSYGTGSNMGPLASRDLPDFLNLTDWDLHRPHAQNISAQVPTMGAWRFEGEDFWNGCVMARWGAYWDPNARPVIWDPNDPDNWPARKTVAGWEPGSTGILDLPLHLSDAPPDANDPNTRFTAYSWPDARISGLADHQLNEVMRLTTEPGHSTFDFYGIADNHWHLRAIDRGGSLLCPQAPIVPLTDDITLLQAANHYDALAWPTTRWGQTFLHLGIVWGLRALSPLWRDVWNTTSVSGDDLPRTPCLEGETQNCSPSVEKAIVIVTDGANVFGWPRRGRTSGTWHPSDTIIRNPVATDPRCDAAFRDPLNTVFRAAVSAGDAATFAAGFDVDASGVFTPTGMSAVLDGFQEVHPVVTTLDPVLDRILIDQYRLVWENALRDMTPWQLFRGYDGNSPTANTDATDVLTDPANAFGFEGRPVQNTHHCRLTSPFSAYGRGDELVRVGDGPPVSGVAPFSNPTWLYTSSTRDLQDTLTDGLDDWFWQACDLAGQRGVRIHAIYIGGATLPAELEAIALLEGCVDRGYGSNPVVDEVHTTPTSQRLKEAIEEIMDIKRSLRFVEG